MPKIQAPASSESAILSRVIGRSKIATSPEAAQILLELGFTEDDRKRMHELVVKNQQGGLSPEDEQDLDTYVRIGRLLDLLSAHAAKSLSRASVEPRSAY